MTAYRCWIEYPNDKPLQRRVARGELGEPGVSPFESLPIPPTDPAWPSVVTEWCRARGLTPTRDGLIVSVRVKRADIEDFLRYVYGGSPCYFDPAKMLTWKGRAYLANRLNDLRACVAQQLTSRLWYVLRADEF